VSYLRTLIALALVAALALLLAGCGGGTDVDFTKASETVRASLESKREGFGVPVENVDCPKGVKVEPGTYFQCTVRYPDGKVAYARLKIRTAEADLSLESLSPHPAEGQAIH
jgi:chromosome condensin MukBEF MukE localization factor